MNDLENALPPEGGAELTQNPPSPVGPDRRDRPLLALTMLFCLFVADTFPLDLVNGGMTALVLAWYLLVFLFARPAGMSQRSNQLLFLTNLLLAWSLVLTSSLNFRVWNALALLALVPLHAVGLSGAGRLPWWRPAMLWERLCLLIGGLFGHLVDAFAVLSPSAPKGRLGSYAGTPSRPQPSCRLWRFWSCCICCFWQSNPPDFSAGRPISRPGASPTLSGPAAVFFRWWA